MLFSIACWNNITQLHFQYIAVAHSLLNNKMNKWLMNNYIKYKLPNKVKDTEEISNKAYALKEFKIVQK